MKKFIALTVICSVVIMAAYFSACNNNKTAPKEINDKDSVKKVLEKGEYLAIHVAGCIDCHSKRDFDKYSGPPIPGTEGGGGLLFDEKFGLPGKLYGKNILPQSSQRTHSSRLPSTTSSVPSAFCA